jgi:Cys-tRNA(Pro) deacylase
MTKATEYLAEHAIPHQLFRHAARPDSIDQAAHERNQQPDQIVRSILFRLPEDKYVMVLMPGPKQISWKKLRAILGSRRIALATPGEVLQMTGYQIGAVSPIGINPAIRILVEQTLQDQSEISLGSGEHGLAIIMTTNYLFQALPAVELVRVSEAIS